MDEDQHLLKCRRLGLDLIPDPMGDDHHCDAPMTPEDAEIGSSLAHFLGTLFSDIDGDGRNYFYRERTSVDEWTRVARALRVHGLKIMTEK